MKVISGQAYTFCDNGDESSENIHGISKAIMLGCITGKNGLIEIIIIDTESCQAIGLEETLWGYPIEFESSTVDHVAAVNTNNNRCRVHSFYSYNDRFTGS